ncbi:MAG: RNA 2',3'-cyclic phosphodiesterase [Thermoplasmata archaeon]
MRCFVAVDVAVNEALASLLKEVRGMGKPVEGDNLHLTLKFLGEIEDSRVAEEKLSEIRFHRFHLTLKGLGAFPDPNKARVLFVNAVPIDDVSRLASQVDAGTKWIALDHPFHPHITILRMKNQRDLSSFISRYSSVVFGEEEITSFKLYRSTLTPSGPVYTVIKSFQLM